MNTIVLDSAVLPTHVHYDSASKNCAADQSHSTDIPKKFINNLIVFGKAVDAQRSVRHAVAQLNVLLGAITPFVSTCRIRGSTVG